MENLSTRNWAGPAKPKGWLGMRHCQAFIMFLGVLLAYSMRVNLSVGIVAMTDPTTNPNFETVDWSALQKSNLLSMFFYGYLVSNIIAGYLANKLGPKTLVSIAGLSSGLTTVLIPYFALNFGYVATCALRVGHGLFQGFFYPCTNAFMSKWAIAEERSRLFSFIFSGGPLGSIVVLALGGVIAAGPGGWPTIFYATGGCSIAWGIACFIFASESPSLHRSISEDERVYIETHLAESSIKSKEMPVPWKDIATSVPFIALVVAQLGQNWGFWTLLTLLPTYMRGVLNFDISTNGFLSSLPYVAMFITSFIFPFFADYLIEKKYLSLTASRKIWNSIAGYGGALAILMLAFYNSSAVIAVTLVTIAVGLNSASFSGYLCVPLDLSPNFAGVLMGLMNGISSTTSIAAPTIAGVIVKDESNVSQWEIVFLLSAAIFALGNTVFIIRGSAQTQPWNEPKGEHDSTRV